MATLDAALDLWRRGLSVIPIPVGSRNSCGFSIVVSEQPAESFPSANGPFHSVPWGRMPVLGELSNREEMVLRADEKLSLCGCRRRHTYLSHAVGLE